MTPEDMCRRISEARGVAITRLRSRIKQGVVSWTRAEVIYVLREATELSYPEVAPLAGMRNHTSAIAAYRKVEARVQARPALHEELLSLIRPTHRERLSCASVSCSGCIPARVAA